MSPRATTRTLPATPPAGQAPKGRRRILDCFPRSRGSHGYPVAWALTRSRRAIMHSIVATTTLCGVLILPSLGSAQTPNGPRLDRNRQEVFQSLRDSQWVRLAGTGLSRHDGRVLDVTPTEIVLSPEQQPIRVAATSIDTVWTRRHSAVRGGIVGGLLLGALGAVVGASIGESSNDDYDPAVGALVFGGAGLVGGGLLGALVGAGIPRWHREYP